MVGTSAPSSPGRGAGCRPAWSARSGATSVWTMVCVFDIAVAMESDCAAPTCARRFGHPQQLVDLVARPGDRESGPARTRERPEGHPDWAPSTPSRSASPAPPSGPPRSRSAPRRRRRHRACTASRYGPAGSCGCGSPGPPGPPRRSACPARCAAAPWPGSDHPAAVCGPNGTRRGPDRRPVGWPRSAQPEHLR